MVTTPPGFGHDPEVGPAIGAGQDDRPVDDQRGNGAAVAGLAREVEAMRQQVDALEELPGRVDQLADTVVRLAETIRPATDDDSGVTSWLDLPRRHDDAHRVLEELVDWLGRVYLRYADAAGLPECWMWHPDVVEELIWLMQTWQAAYHTGRGASVTLAADWHDRYRPGVVRRITQTAGNCSIQRHRSRDGRARPGTAPTVPLTAAATDIAKWWGRARAEPAPEPTDAHIDQATAYAYARDQGARA